MHRGRVWVGNVWQTTRPGECQVLCMVSEGDLWSWAVGSQSLSDGEACIDENWREEVGGGLRSFPRLPLVTTGTWDGSSLWSGHTAQWTVPPCQQHAERARPSDKCIPDTFPRSTWHLHSYISVTLVSSIVISFILFNASYKLLTYLLTIFNTS